MASGIGMMDSACSVSRPFFQGSTRLSSSNLSKIEEMCCPCVRLILRPRKYINETNQNHKVVEDVSDHQRGSLLFFIHGIGMEGRLLLNLEFMQWMKSKC
ncbi:unnamed protein product, partial [Vitis vinifera]|uniref:Uncharacterized protein n=1 Tax=Vitis vinifera TaxID=29760 RepID=E0CPQ4_VITVI